MDDPRLTPARGDLAAKYLEGKVQGGALRRRRDVRGTEPIAPVRERPSADAMLLTQALKGERVTIYDRNGEGWAWGQLDGDGYVGWLPDSRAGQAGRRADPPGQRNQDVRVSGSLDQTAADRRRW